MSRTFPPPWIYEQTAGGYIVKDARGQTVAWIYARTEEEGREVAKVLTWDEARRIAANIAKLPELLKSKL